MAQINADSTWVPPCLVFTTRGSHPTPGPCLGVGCRSTWLCWAQLVGQWRSRLAYVCQWGRRVCTTGSLFAAKWKGLLGGYFWLKSKSQRVFSLSVFLWCLSGKRCLWWFGVFQRLRHLSHHSGFEESPGFQEPVRPLPLCFYNFQTHFPCHLTPSWLRWCICGEREWGRRCRNESIHRFDSKVLLVESWSFSDQSLCGGNPDTNPQQ